MRRYLIASAFALAFAAYAAPASASCGGNVPKKVDATITFSGNKCHFGSLWSSDIFWLITQGNGSYMVNIQTKEKCSGIGTVEVRVTGRNIHVVDVRAQCGKRHKPYRV